MRIEGIYLVADAALDLDKLHAKLSDAFSAGVKLLQLYNTDKTNSHNILHTKQLCELHQVTLIFSNHWKLALKYQVDGVHFDEIPEQMHAINEELPPHFIKGLTLGNDLGKIAQAESFQFDYFSFCSLFPSSSAGDCEIVDFDSILKAKKLTKLPLFAAGGINLQNIKRLAQLPLNGIALISSIMEAEDTQKAVKLFSNELNKIVKK